MKFLNFGVLSLFVIVTFAACASSGSVGTDSSPSTNSIFPVWYQSTGVSSDSTSYSGYATAIAADSLVAIDRAQKQARVNLEKSIAQITEEIRSDLADAGSTNVRNTDFIIILRTAHAQVESAAKLKESISRSTDGYYRGFASVEISRPELREVLEKGFAGHPRYWGEFSSSDGFSNAFE